MDNPEAQTILGTKTQNKDKKTKKPQQRKYKKMSNMDPTKKSGLNTDACEW